MTTLFRAEVERVLKSHLRQVTYISPGMIPQGGVNEANWTCTVQMAHPHVGFTPVGSGDAFTLYDVPLPRAPDGLIQSVANMVANGPVNVIVGFRGSNLSFPCILSILDLHHSSQTVPQQTVEGRSSAVLNRFRTEIPPVFEPFVTLFPPGRMGKVLLEFSDQILDAASARVEQTKRAIVDGWNRMLRGFGLR